MPGLPFTDRCQAGKHLAEALEPLIEKDTVILAIPRGGVVVAYEVAQFFDLPLDVVIPRKIGAPGNPELAIGAVTDDGSVYINRYIAEMVGADEGFILQEISRQIQEIRQREKSYRKNRPPIQIENKTVIIIDDGVATGSTIIATANALRARNPKKIIIAVPVAPPDAIKRLQEVADEVVCLFTPELFFAVGQFYQDFTQTTHEEVVELLRNSI